LRGLSSIAPRKTFLFVYIDSTWQKGALQKESKKDEQGSQKRLPCSPFAFKMDV
jgi:hypothetical protein